MSHTWNHERASTHIDKKMEDVETVTIKQYGRDMSLESIATNAAYRVDGVHMYADIQNLREMLNVTDVGRPGLPQAHAAISGPTLSRRQSHPQACFRRAAGGLPQPAAALSLHKTVQLRGWSRKETRATCGRNGTAHD